MNDIKKKLTLINHFWNYYVLEYLIIREEILNNKETKTNYYGDLVNYFLVTIELIAQEPKHQGFQNNIFYYTGLLQLIYSHQDLMDELLKIFKIEKSSNNDKNPNRTIRNETIGHPINRHNRSKELKSSVFWGKHLSNRALHYVIYSSENDFKPLEIKHNIKDIIDRHIFFLNKYLDAVLAKIKTVLLSYTNKLERLQNIVDKNSDFLNLVDHAEELLKPDFFHNPLFNRSYLIECHNMKDKHPRYKNVVELFIQDIKTFLYDVRVDIKSILTGALHKANDFETAFGSTTTDINLEVHQSTSESYAHDYPLSKLHQRNHTVFNIAYFNELFCEDAEIIQELNFMELNQDSTFEYYCSFEYLKLLIKGKNRN